MDPEIRLVLETTAILMREGHVVRDPRHLYEDANGVIARNAAEAACGCLSGCLQVAAWNHCTLGFAAEEELRPYLRYGSPTTTLREGGAEACIAAIERALGASS